MLGKHPMLQEEERKTKPLLETYAHQKRHYERCKSFESLDQDNDIYDAERNSQGTHIVCYERPVYEVCKVLTKDSKHTQMFLRKNS